MNFHLTLITENQTHPEKAQQLVALIVKILDANCESKISKYTKNDNAYKIELRGALASNIDAIDFTDRLCSPWSVTYNRSENTIELLFNKTAYSRFRNNELNVINWAHFETETESI